MFTVIPQITSFNEKLKLDIEKQMKFKTNKIHEKDESKNEHTQKKRKIDKPKNIVA